MKVLSVLAYLLMIVFLFVREFVASRKRRDRDLLRMRDVGAFFFFWPCMIIPDSVENKSELAMNAQIVVCFVFAIWSFNQFDLLTLLVLASVTALWTGAVKALLWLFDDAESRVEG